jgi:hypothetical protein
MYREGGIEKSGTAAHPAQGPLPMQKHGRVDHAAARPRRPEAVLGPDEYAEAQSKTKDIGTDCVLTLICAPQRLHAAKQRLYGFCGDGYRGEFVLIGISRDSVLMAVDLK